MAPIYLLKHISGQLIMNIFLAFNKERGKDPSRRTPADSLLNIHHYSEPDTEQGMINKRCFVRYIWKGG